MSTLVLVELKKDQGYPVKICKTKVLKAINDVKLKCEMKDITDVIDALSKDFV